MTTTYKKKLIEVAIPLEAINAASAREKSIRHGHPSTLHLWWARRPLAACRAVLFAQLVDDPSSHPDKFPTDEAVEVERKRLFTIIEELVKWENSTNEEVLERARAEIRASCDGELPPVYDPFSGGGSIPLEAQRLGLPAYGSDLNPVAVMIGKAMIEIPPKFKDMEPIHPGLKERNHYRNAEGLAEDVKYYGEWMLQRARERIGHLYPQVDLSGEYGGDKATVIAWIWTRTVPSPDPAFSDAQVPIASSFMLNSKKGREVWVEPIIDKAAKSIEWRVRSGGTREEIEHASSGAKSGRGNFRCLFSEAAITGDYVRKMGQAGKLGCSMMAIVAEGKRRRHYLAPSDSQISAAMIEGHIGKITDYRELHLSGSTPSKLTGGTAYNYGLTTWGDLFSDRQVAAMRCLIQQLDDVQKEIQADIDALAPHEDDTPIADGGVGLVAYSEAVRTYLGLAINRVAMSGNTLVRWNPVGEKAQHIFSRQAIPMLWDYAETNPLGSATGAYSAAIDMAANGLATLMGDYGEIVQADAQTVQLPPGAILNTDPPYYDNIAYADLSDFFYCWLRLSLKKIFPSIFGIIATPKAEELVATRYRHATKEKAESFFLDGMSRALANSQRQITSNFPVAIYYAFKQSEVSQEGISSTGWSTFLHAVIDAGFSVVGTWPVRTEMRTRQVAMGTNALANSVVLVCRKKEVTAETITRAEFIRTLKRELPPAIAELQSANVSPADMPQSAIGPGMGVFSRYKAVLEADDSPMTVKTALQLINAELDEFLNDLHGEFDADTRFAATWFEQHGTDKGDYGAADNLARARGISVQSVKHAGIVDSSAGKVRILKRAELDPDWDPVSDDHLTIWEGCQHLIRVLENDGEYAAAELIKKLGPDRVEMVKDLAYYLYDICSNKRKDAKEATSYNGLIAVWTDLTRLAAAIRIDDVNRQTTLDI
jgi:putative DNA methylase